MEVNGFWETEVEKAGRYEITLRERPEEAPAETMQARSAHLEIGAHQQTKPVAPGASAVSFEVRLDSGRTRLRSRLTENRGAYYAYARRLD